MGSTPTRTATGVLLCVGMLLAACGDTPGTDVVREEGTAATSPDVDDAATDPGVDDASTGPATDDDASTATGSEDTGPFEDSDALLVDALARFDELRRVDTAELRGYCVQLSDWAALRDAAPVVDQVEDAGFTVRNEVELTMFGCAAARREPQLFGVQVTVERAPLDLPEGLDPAATPGGRQVLVGEAELGDLSLFSGAPVSAAVLVGQEMVLHVTALPDLLAPEQLPLLVDAALQDLAAGG